MSECTCHKNYTLDTLIPQVGVITDIHEETPVLLHRMFLHPESPREYL